MRTVITSSKFIETLNLDLSELTRQGIVVHFVEDLRASLTLTDKLWLKFRGWPKNDRIVAARDPESVAIVLFTSGSEGRPKGVAITHANIAAVNTSALGQPGNTVGPMLPSMEFRIAPLPGLQRGGVLHVRGPNVMKGYLLPDHPGELSPTGSAFSPGWAITSSTVAVTNAQSLRLSAGPVAADLKRPASFSLSSFTHVNDRWKVMFDASWTGWSSFERLVIQPTNTLDVVSDQPQNWRDTWRLFAGATTAGART